MNKLTFILIIIATLVRPDYVYLDKLEQRFGTKTPYRLVANEDLNLGFYPGCELKKIWMMVRHGTRYPSAKIIRDMKEKLPDIKEEILALHKQGKGCLTAIQIAALKDWFPVKVEVSEEKKLVPEGGNEMFLLAQRMKKRFRELLPDIFDNNIIKIRHTSTERANESAKHFAAGLFGDGAKDVKTIPSLQEHDPVLRFYKQCERWRQEVKKNSQTYKEQQLYLNGKEMKNALKEISKKFGLPKTLSQDIGKLIFQTCAFESAWNKTNLSPWCSAFTEKSIQPFEYAEDLKYYWMDGYGHTLTKKLPCKVIEDITNFFNTSNGHLSAFHFTHSGTLLKTLAYFGLYEPKSALRHNIRDPNRPWRSSRIDAFGSNLAFLFYRCGAVDKFLTLHQEMPVRLPGCDKDSHLCSLKVLHDARLKDGCDVNEMCKMPDTSTTPNSEL